ncbi:MAG: RNA polymerase sigma factor [Woeseia sp.]
MDSSTREQLNDNMARLADGDRKAFDVVYELLWPVINSFARRLMRAPDLADDMAQQALIKIFYNAGTFEAGRDALTWALSIAANECRSLLRRRSERAHGLLSDDTLANLISDTPSPLEHAEREQLKVFLRDLLTELQPHEAETLLIQAWDLERPDIPAATFRKRVQRALARARSLWSQRNRAH